MKSPFECPVYAQECRALANGNSEDRRREVLRLADIWEGSARGEDRQPRQTYRADSFGFGLDPRKVWAAGIRARYDEMARQPLPNRFRDLLKRLDNVAWRR